MSLLPENTPTYCIGEIFSVSSGGTPNRKKEEFFTNGHIPWVKTGDLKGKFANKPTEHITQLGLDASSAKLFPPKTVLLAMYGATIGACSILNFEAATNQACAALLPNLDCNESYLYYFLSSIEKSLINKGVGGAQPNISAGLIKKIKIPLPSLKEQKKIIEILDAADRLRQKDKQLIEHYTALSQSLFLDMFGDPVANTLNLDVKKLGELTSKISSGNTPKGGSAVYVENGILFLRSQNVWRNKLELDDVAYLPSELHEKMQKTSLLNGDILMTKTGRFNTENSSLGRAAMYRGEDNQANLNGHVYLIRVKDDFSKEFILHILTTPQYRDYIRRVCVGGIDKRQLNKTHLEDFPIICPAKELQLKFVAALNKIEVQKQKAEQSLMKSEELFNCLLQRAFKGELTSDKAA